MLLLEKYNVTHYWMQIKIGNFIFLNHFDKYSKVDFVTDNTFQSAEIMYQHSTNALSNYLKNSALIYEF